MTRTQVVIVGGGPAGLLLAHLLHRHGIASVVLERREREQVLARVRAGVIEPGTADILRHAGVGARLDAEGREHTGINIGFAGTLQRIDIKRLTHGKVLTVYGQTEITKDLYAVVENNGTPILHGAEVGALDQLDGAQIAARYQHDNRLHQIMGSVIVGCDGAHSMVRQILLDAGAAQYKRDGNAAWLGVLAHVPPVAAELVYATHARGFALCSQRSPTVSRCYIQVPRNTQPEDWTDAEFWDELRYRLPPTIADHITVGPASEKSVAVIRSFVVEPMQSERVFLVGDAAHVVPPTGAKGLNLALADARDLAEVLAGYFAGDRPHRPSYPKQVLARTWQAMRFSWWMTNLLHTSPHADEYANRIRWAELSYLCNSPVAQTALAESYIGLSSATIR